MFPKNEKLRLIAIIAAWALGITTALAQGETPPVNSTPAGESAREVETKPTVSPQSPKPAPVKILQMDPRYWVSMDATGAKPPSEWYVSEGLIKQTANTVVESKAALKSDPDVERKGTMYVYRNGMDFADGEFSLELQCTDDDGVGVAFRWNSESRFYLWNFNRQRNFSALAVKNGAFYETLASNRNGFVQRVWYRIRIVTEGDKITVFINNKKEFEGNDPTFAKGTVALYCWGNSGSLFRNLKFRPGVTAEQAESETLGPLAP